ncbi:hypothetical protein BGZ70_008009 [Mortierella alpina]|uniref:DNA mismatch repair protein PMS1 n=1 Tax=Mortierella alpina TaxID=64518 RepID=A0A9P6M1F3_MORAP|nr:hypothetical protein BGZ70_008009 [Mortierella alpina]
MAGNNTIKAIDKESVHRICSGQVVLDMATAVKELLENSLDAGATSIVIKFKQNGLDHITVTDNGCGITDTDLETLALKHYTSKLTSFNDLAQVRSFGFRGEALSSLCALSSLTVSTSTGQKPTGVLVEYNSDGLIKSKTPVPMTKGTTIRISNLFEGMPVRRNEFVKNIKREYTKCIGLIQAYALIATNVRISCVSQMDKKPAVNYIATSGNATIRQNIINVFGPKAMVDVIDFTVEIVQGPTDLNSNLNGAADEDGEEESNDESKGGITLSGHISSPFFGKGRSSADRQYLFINGRPCVLPKITRVINEVYHSFNTNQSPFLVANLVLPTSYYDVNVSPDKRTIFLHNERMIVEELRNKLTELFEPSRSTFAVSEARLLIKKPDLSTRLTAGLPSRAADAGEESEDMDADKETVTEDGSIERKTVAEDAKFRISSVIPATTSATVTGGTRVSAELTAGAIIQTVARLEQTTLTNKVVRPVNTSSTLKRKAHSNFSDSDEETEVAPKSRGHSSAVQHGTATLVEDDEEAEVGILALNNTIPSAASSETFPSSIAEHSDATLDVLEGYDPLDDKTREDKDDPISDSEDEQVLAAHKQRREKMQRVVVLDSEVHQDGDREWVEVAFDIENHRRRRALRMKIVQETRRVEQERMALRRERAKRKLAEQQQSQVDAQVSRPMDDECEKEEEEEEEEEEKEAGLDPATKIRKSRRLRSLKLSDASFANTDNTKAQTSLSRVISKGDFARMKVLGQFNKAFIVTRLDNYVDTSRPENRPDRVGRSMAGRGRQGKLISSDIFVIDQHASDEKYNFETLQAKTVFSTQRLFQPKKLHLTAQEEITVVDHMNMLNKNGFYLDYDPQEPVSNRLKLVTLPVSERVVFDLQDFEELVFLLSQQTASSIGGADDPSDQEQGSCGGHPTGTVTPQESNGSSSEKMVRCSKVRALFASRACRRSVMIGHVLNHGQMKRIVRHMGEIDQPWNCPHGRPTMRHLLDLAELEQQERRARLMGAAQDSGQDFEDDLDEQEKDLVVQGLSLDGLGAFDPVALKRPTRHQGSLFKQFMAIPTPTVSL